MLLVRKYCYMLLYIKINLHNFDLTLFNFLYFVIHVFINTAVIRMFLDFLI